MSSNNNVSSASDDLKSARKYVDRLLDDGADLPVDESVDSYEMTLPEWYDDEQFKRAQRYYHANIFAMFGGMLIGLLSVLAIPTILRVLMHTRGSGTPLTAYRRYLETIFHMRSWYDEDLRPGTRSWRSIEAVRKRHVRVSLSAQRSGVGIVSQKDMALTQFGFIGFILLKPHLLGVQVTREDHEALVHFWRVIGHMMGIRDEYNLCTESWSTTRPRLQLVIDDIFRPHMNATGADFQQMAEQLIAGLWCFSPLLSAGSHIYFAKFVCGCKDYVYYGADVAMLDGSLGHQGSVEACIAKREQLGQGNRIRLGVVMALHTFGLNFAWLRWYMNAQIYISTVIIRWFPFLAIYSFGWRMSYVRILGEGMRQPK